jgi:hypothetical protein
MTEKQAMQKPETSYSESTGVWYCPVCGYIDPQTTDTHCPKAHASGIRRPMFREARRGYYVRVGIHEAVKS